MEIYLQSCPERLVTIDETHKDRNAARRRRGWGRKGNAGGVIVRAWFENVAIYTLTAVIDVNEFIPAACHTVLRDEISDEGAARTVDGNHFYITSKSIFSLCWEAKRGGKSRYVVMMDDTSTHMGDTIE